MTIANSMTTFYYIFGDYMISYEPFWKTLKARGESTYTLINKHGISSATIDRMKKGKGITTQKINDFCYILNCRVEDIIKYEPSPDDGG